MAVYYSRKSGNVNATDVWSTTPTGTAGAVTFTSADVLMAQSGHSITLNVSTTVAEVRTDTANGATGGGTVFISDGVTLTANVFAGAATNRGVMFSGSSGATIIGTITGGTGNGSAGGALMLENAAGTVTVVGSVIGGTGSGGHGVFFSINSNVTVNITGSVTANAATGIIIPTTTSGTPVVNVTGTVSGGATNGISHAYASATVTVTGAAVGGASGAGVSHTGAGSLSVTRAKGNGFGNGSVGLSAAVGVAGSQTGASRVSEIEYGALGQSPTSGPILLTDATSNVAVFYKSGGGTKTLVDNSATVDYPANSNVRSGTVFANGNRTGTCAVPAASSVASGVAVDATTGTATLTGAAVQSACDAALAAFSSGRLANVATVASTGQQLAAAVGA